MADPALVLEIDPLPSIRAIDQVKQKLDGLGTTAKQTEQALGGIGKTSGEGIRVIRRNMDDMRTAANDATKSVGGMGGAIGSLRGAATLAGGSVALLAGGG
ncbi:MAG: hypothetical protein KF735_08570 [Chelatococcus sp.]|uniref:hypothetical protein n=1 Tax=Chelatococcus sp. TaxID=1953771 RepID=UPI0025C6B33F|nr:hypothetical protein [Chelatococcus sp.]MBX3537677.1 hypothetical protein [Chelatococcus sp.]